MSWTSCATTSAIRPTAPSSSWMPAPCGTRSAQHPMRRGGRLLTSTKPSRPKPRSITSPSSAPNLDGDVIDLGFGLLGFVLVSNRPPRRMGCCADLVPQGAGIQLDDGAVGLIAEVVAQLVQLINGFDQFLFAATDPGLFRCFQPKRLQPLQDFAVPFRRIASFEMAQ